MMVKKLQTFHSLNNTKQTLKQMTVKSFLTADGEHSVGIQIFIWHADIDL